MSARIALLLTGVFGLLAIACGAFGAHALKPQLLATGRLSAWETAVQYHLMHSVVLLAAALFLASRGESAPEARWLRRAVLAWSLGIVFFSGSLYWIALGGPRWLGPVTPIGGVAFIFAWAYLIPAAFSLGKK
ncbi:DUF423 domain-containing protein [Cephaloticoccus primus]|nr:DUF423 domain-containing protein [Cephaloticoccus primus]